MRAHMEISQQNLLICVTIKLIITTILESFQQSVSMSCVLCANRFCISYSPRPCDAMSGRRLHREKGLNLQLGAHSQTVGVPKAARGRDSQSEHREGREVRRGCQVARLTTPLLTSLRKGLSPKGSTAFQRSASSWRPVF